MLVCEPQHYINLINGLDEVNNGHSELIISDKKNIMKANFWVLKFFILSHTHSSMTRLLVKGQSECFNSVKHIITIVHHG